MNQNLEITSYPQNEDKKTRFKRVEGKQRKIWHGTRDKPVNRKGTCMQVWKKGSGKVDFEILPNFGAIECKIEFLLHTFSINAMTYILVERDFAID
jgi:hypothetical protein